MGYDLFTVADPDETSLSVTSPTWWTLIGLLERRFPDLDLPVVVFNDGTVVDPKMCLRIAGALRDLVAADDDALDTLRTQAARRAAAGREAGMFPADGDGVGRPAWVRHTRGLVRRALVALRRV